jgi:hypothetical protein
MSPEVATPPLHSHRVQAWIYAILNPVIEGLGRETFFLGKGNLTWQSDTRKCEYIQPIRGYFQYSQWPNYEDFVADPQNLDFKQKFEAHDQALSVLESSASAFADDQLQLEQFQKQVDDSLAEYQISVRENPCYPFLDDSPAGSRARGVTALLVNRLDVLPHHYGTHKFWEIYKHVFEPYRERPSFEMVKNATDNLMHVSSGLLRDAGVHRQSLCRTYDIPPAPIPESKSRAADGPFV